MENKTYYVRSRGRVSGPYDLQKLKFLRDRGQLARFHEVSEDRQFWVQAGAIDELFPSPRAEPAPQAVAAATKPGWFYAEDNGPQQGPVDAVTLARLWSSRRIGDATLVWQDGMEKWLPIAALPAGSIPELPASRPRRGRLWPWALAGVALLVAAPACWFLYTQITAKRENVTAITPQTWAARLIDSTTDETSLAGGVGLVVCGVHCVHPDGSEGDEPHGTGTCFAITADGYLITNKHVVEKTRNLKNAKLLLKRLQDELLLAVTPQVWVFFGKNKHIADLVHVSDEHDFAILKISRAGGPYFQLAGSDSLARGKKVIACGFPGVASKAINEEEMLLQLNREMINKLPKTRVETRFLAREFEYTLTDGTVSRVTSEESSNRRWIQHTASINEGNSGGPLLNEEGTVLGINTFYIKGKGSNVFFALPVAQLRADIAKHVPGALWSE